MNGLNRSRPSIPNRTVPEGFLRASVGSLLLASQHPTAMRRRAGRAISAAPGGFLHLSLLASLRQRPSLQAHAQILLLGLPLPASAASRLLRPHLLSGHPRASLRLFLLLLRHQQPSPNPKEAFPDSHTLSAALAACSRLPSSHCGLSIHSFLLKSGFASNRSVANSLLHFYATFGLHSLARRVFDEMPMKDTVSFNTLIGSCVRSCCIEDALRMFTIMVHGGCQPDGWTATALLSACIELSDLRVGKAVHGIARRMLWPEVFESGQVVSMLVDLYMKCGAVALARRVFDSVGESARDVRLWSAMVLGYARAGEVDLAQMFFGEMPEKDLVTWTAFIGGFIRAGRYKEALELFEEMEETGFEADELMVVTVLSACTCHGTIELGKRLHRRMEHDGLISRNARLATSFVDMYAKHGCIQAALDVFHRVGDEFKSVELFNAMIHGLAHRGLGEKAIALLDEMTAIGLRPDKITFVGVLSACGHGGLVSQGFQIFDSMVEKYGIGQEIEHYACMADLLARDGQLDGAYHFIQSMPFKANHVVWSSLLRACRIQSNSKVGKIAEKHLLEFDHCYKPENLPLSDLFADERRKKQAERLRNVINYRSKHRHTKYSYIEWNGNVYQFSTVYTSHPQAKVINLMLEDMSRQLSFSGYEVGSEKTAHQSEMVALAFGLINSVPETPIKIVTSFRMCGSCHASFKYFSKIYNRDISVNDRIRFHEIKLGSCSCMDYW